MSKKEEEKVEEKAPVKDSAEKARRRALIDLVLKQNPVKYLPQKDKLDAWVNEAK